MTVREDIPLAPYTTFRMGPVARFVIDIESPDDLPAAFSFIRERELPFFVLGGGSNVILTAPERYEGVVLKMGILGFAIEEGALVRIGAGEEWDEVVGRTVEEGLSGIEALSAIPGLAGATPMQNVGAYGTEIADVLESVEAYDYREGKMVTIPATDCALCYRDSAFKHQDRYVITSLSLRLSKAAPTAPDYPGVAAYFAERGIKSPSLSDIREAIIAIRASKLPDPSDVPSVGSFFKNPIVTQDVAERLRREFEKPVIFDLPDGKHKVGAGWLIDTLGLKGKSFGSIAVYPNNALVLTNAGGATYPELTEVISMIQNQVRERFGIELEPEPMFI